MTYGATLGAHAVSHAVQRSGLDPADRVIVNGLMRTRPNAKVTPVKAARRPPAATPGPAPE